MTPFLGDWATASAHCGLYGGRGVRREKVAPDGQPPGPLEPPPLSEPEVVVVVEPEPSSEPELDPEEPPSEELPPEPSRPELVEVLLVLTTLPGPSEDGWATAVVLSEPSFPLPETP